MPLHHPITCTAPTSCSSRPQHAQYKSLQPCTGSHPDALKCSSSPSRRASDRQIMGLAVPLFLLSWTTDPRPRNRLYSSQVFFQTGFDLRSLVSVTRDVCDELHRLPLEKVAVIWNAVKQKNTGCSTGYYTPWDYWQGRLSNQLVWDKSTNGEIDIKCGMRLEPNYVMVRVRIYCMCRRCNSPAKAFTAGTVQISHYSRKDVRRIVHKERMALLNLIRVYDFTTYIRFGCTLQTMGRLIWPILPTRFRSEYYS